WLDSCAFVLHRILTETSFPASCSSIHLLRMLAFFSRRTHPRVSFMKNRQNNEPAPFIMSCNQVIHLHPRYCTANPETRGPRPVAAIPKDAKKAIGSPLCAAW